MEFLLPKCYWECWSINLSEVLIHIKKTRYVQYSEWNQKVWSISLTVNLFTLPTCLSWWQRKNQSWQKAGFWCISYIFLTSEQWWGELALPVNIRHNWDCITSAEDDTQKMETKHCINFPQFQAKLQCQWLTSEIQNNFFFLFFFSWGWSKQKFRVTYNGKIMLSLKHHKLWICKDY